MRDLGDAEFGLREKAFVRLAELGTVALDGLKTAENDTNPEVRRRVAELKRRVEAKTEAAVLVAAARVLARSKPAGAADVLLGYVPFASDAVVIDEIGKALGAVAVRGGQVEPAIVQALESGAAIKRGLAGEALARSGVKEQLPAVRKLLKDRNPSVQLRVAMALVMAKEKEAVPVLVDLLGELNADQLWQVEEVLVRLADKDAPNIALGSDEASRKAARTAWQGWLATHRDTLNLDRVGEAAPMLGFTTLVQQHFNRPGVGVAVRRVGGEVIELDKDRKVRWKFDVDTYPVDAVVVGPDRVLVAEYQAGRVTERNFKGEIKWEKAVNGNPIGVQRLSNGNTFVVMQNRLLEIDRKGEPAGFDHQRPQHDIMRARKVRNGDVVFVTNLGVLTRMEPKSLKVVNTFNVGQVQVLFGNFDILPNGNILMPEFQNNRVVEYNTTGQLVGPALSVQWPNSAVRLPNGHTLVASQNAHRVTEFDRNGHEYWTYQCDGAVFNAHRR